LTPSQIALLAVLMLRGPQTVAELRTRSERLYPFPSADDVERALLELSERGLAERLPRRPGEREERWVQLLGGDDPARGESLTGDVDARSGHDDDPLDLEARVARVERQLAELLERVDELQQG
jgi:uncharacterized protein YceH (UPF0502 family)